MHNTRRKLIDLVGKRFGPVVVTSFHGLDKKRYYWNCRCVCGRERIVAGSTLRQPKPKNPDTCYCDRKIVNGTDWTGKRSGMLLVIEVKRNTGVGTLLLCLCDCGATKEVKVNTFKKGSTRSCGCYSAQFNSEAHITHGQTKTPEYKMHRRNKHRAKRDGIPFDLDLEDIYIPSHCPLLGIPIYVNDKPKADSASLDKIIPSLGYVKGNVWVVSQKANQMKSNATVDELRLLADNLEKRMLL